MKIQLAFVVAAIATAALGGTGESDRLQAAIAGAAETVEADLVIYGSSPAAVTAAVKARAMGLRPVLVSPEKHIGGLSVSGLGFTDSGNTRAIGGLARDFYRRVYSAYRRPESWKWQRMEDFRADGQETKAINHEEKTMWTFEPHVAEQVFAEWLAERGVEVHRGEFLDREKGVEKKDGRITSIRTLSGKLFAGRYFIDATYEGDLMAAAGVPYRVGREDCSLFGEKWNGNQVGVLHHRHHFRDWRISPYRKSGDRSSGLCAEVDLSPPGVRGKGDRRVQAYCYRTCMTDDPRNRIPFSKPDGYDPARLRADGQILDLTTTSADTVSEAAAKPVRAGVYIGGGSGGNGAVEWARLVDESPEMSLTLLDGARIREGALDRLDLLIMPGGSASQQQKAIGPDGMDRLRAFIRRGGAYFGTCAGAYLMLERFARVVPFIYCSQDYHLHFVSLDLNERGARAMGLEKGLRKVRYHGGPFMYPSTNSIEGANFEIWETFACEATGKGRVKPQMYGAAATVAGTYGKGRVLVMACHPEYFLSTRRTMTLPALEWVTGRRITQPVHVRRPRALSVAWYSGSSERGVENMTELMRLMKDPGLDVIPVVGDLILDGALDHADALVIPEVSEKARKPFRDSALLRDLLREFQSRGGKILAIGGGSGLVPEGTPFRALSSPQDVLPALSEL